MFLASPITSRNNISSKRNKKRILVKKDGTITNRNLYIYVEGIMARLPIPSQPPPPRHPPNENQSLSRSRMGVGNSVTRKNCQMSINVAKNDFTRKMIDFDTFTKIVLEWGNLGKLIVSKVFEKMPKSNKSPNLVTLVGKCVWVCVRETRVESES